MPVGLCPLDYGVPITTCTPSTGRSASLVPSEVQGLGVSVGLEASAVIDREPLFDNNANLSDSSLSLVAEEEGSTLTVAVVDVKGKGKVKTVQQPLKVAKTVGTRRSRRSKN
jgi:hypothetical protein